MAETDETAAKPPKPPPLHADKVVPEVLPVAQPSDNEAAEAGTFTPPQQTAKAGVDNPSALSMLKAATALKAKDKSVVSSTAIDLSEFHSSGDDVDLDGLIPEATGKSLPIKKIFRLNHSSHLLKSM